MENLLGQIEGAVVGTALNTSGANSVIDRALHVPDAALPAAAQKAHDIAAASAKAAGLDVATPSMWFRAVETVQQGLLDGSIEGLAETAINSAL